MRKLPKIKLNNRVKYLRFKTNLSFFELFKKIAATCQACFLLESLGENENTKNRYSMIGFKPEKIISARGKILKIGRKSFKVNNPYVRLAEIMPEPVLSLQYTGGLVGYLSYEATNYFEPGLKLKEPPDFDQFRFGLYTDGLLYDNATEEIHYFYVNQNRSHELKKILASKKPQSATKVVKIGPNLNKQAHKTQVLSVLKEIKAGNTFQCEVGLKVHYKIEGPKLPLYERLRQVNPSPYMYYIQFGKQIVLGSSPELLFSLKGRQMETFPLAGTVRRGKNQSEDLRLARLLLDDPKEQAEHKMLVDLHRNDLGRVAKFGTVCVRRFMDIKKFSHVQHLSSEITGIIKPSANMFSALASCFPAGTLSGAPKIESMKIIARNESSPRGPYGGAAGYFGFNGDCDFAIPIRSLFINGGRGYTQACGGIVYDSIPKNEYEEISNKLKALDIILSQFQ